MYVMIEHHISHPFSRLFVRSVFVPSPSVLHRSLKVRTARQVSLSGPHPPGEVGPGASRAARAANTRRPGRPDASRRRVPANRRRSCCFRRVGAADDPARTDEPDKRGVQEVPPSPATRAVFRLLKAGESVFQAPLLTKKQCFIYLTVRNHCFKHVLASKYCLERFSPRLY